MAWKSAGESSNLSEKYFRPIVMKTCNQKGKNDHKSCKLISFFVFVFRSGPLEKFFMFQKILGGQTFKLTFYSENILYTRESQQNS